MEKFSSGYKIENPLDDIREDNQNPSYLGNPVFDPNALNSISQVIFFPISTRVPDTAAATAANYGYFFVADRPYEIISITERHKTAGTDGGAVTLQVEKIPTGTAKSSGTDLLATAINLKGTADTTQYGTLTTTKTALILKRGDSIGLETSGTLTSVADVCVTIILRAI